MKKEKRYYEEPSVRIIDFQDLAIFTDMNGTTNGSPGSEDFDKILGEGALSK